MMENHKKLGTACLWEDSKLGALEYEGLKPVDLTFGSGQMKEAL
jgi:hypothetical protein